jgi:dephospho-CoA kinase
MIKIGLVGRNGSGKSSVCEYLAQKGFLVYSLSDSLREVAFSQNIPLDRDHLIELGTTLKAKEGSEVLAKRMWEKASLDTHDLSINGQVFDSIRLPEEATFLKQKGVHMVAIEVPIQERYQRIRLRNRETDHISFETFQEQEAKEDAGKGQNLVATRACCEWVWTNDQTPAHLFAQIDAWISGYKKEHQCQS